MSAEKKISGLSVVVRDANGENAAVVQKRIVAER